MDKQHTILSDTSILIDKGVIVGIGPHSELLKSSKADEVVEGRALIAIPGLIDVHGHSTQSALRGVFDEIPLMPWLTMMTDAEKRMNEELLKIGIQLSFLEKLHSGVTTSVDMEGRVDLVAEVALPMGTRLVLAGILTDTEEVPYSGLRRTSSVDDEVKKGRTWYEKYNGKFDGRLSCWFGPVGFPASSPELLRASAAEARRIGTRLHTHAAEGWITPELCKNKHGMREIELLEDIGFLGPDVLLAHCVQLSKKEVYLISKYRSAVAHCPSSNSKLGHGVTPVVQMLRHMVPVGIGTDGAASNNSQDMFVEMKMAAMIQKAVLKNATVMPARTVLELATIGGAHAIGMGDQIGSIEIGKRADIALIDWRKPHMIPTSNIESHLVYNSSGRDVATVIVDGKIVVRDRQLVGMDEEAFLERAESKITEFNQASN
jgi:5-methylthioadenosine/S-adenosylhomocysteine deaminase